MTQHAALKDPEYTTPGTSKGLLDVFRHRYLLTLLLRKGVSTRYYGSVLGWVWSYVRPGAQFLMYYLVIGVIMGAHRDIDYYPIYLFAGITAVNLFSETLRNTTSAIVDNASLVKKIYLPRELFPIAAAGVAMIHFLPQAILLILISIIFGWQFSLASIAAFAAGLIIIMVFAVGLGLFFGAINVAYRDARNIVDIILMFATWASPVLYSWQMVRDLAPSWFFHGFMANPMTVAVELFHNSFWLSLTPETERPVHLLFYTSVAAVISLVTLFIGQLVFRRQEGSFAQNL